MGNRRKLVVPTDKRVLERAPADLAVTRSVDARCQMLLPVPLPDGGQADRPCGRPAHYEFELARSEWAKEPQDEPLIGHACRDHGREARQMPGLMWIRSL